MNVVHIGYFEGEGLSWKKVFSWQCDNICGVFHWNIFLGTLSKRYDNGARAFLAGLLAQHLVFVVFVEDLKRFLLKTTSWGRLRRRRRKDVVL